MAKYNKIQKIVSTSPIMKWFERNERRVSTFFLLTGFVVDSFTLKRVDSLFENLWTVGLILGASVCMVLMHHLERHTGDENDPTKLRFWLVNMLQFFFGGLLSVFLIFYFRSSDFFVSWPFFLILAVAIIANERLKGHYVRLTFQMSLLFLVTFCSAIFLIPVLTHKIGVETFVLAGLLSIIFIWILIKIIARMNPKDYARSKNMLIVSVGGIFIIMNFLYFNNWMPPIPLSLKDSGVYYDIQKQGNGQYIGRYEKTDWKAYFVLYDNFRINSGESVYVYSAVFSPTDLNTTVKHVWQYYDPGSKDWVNFSTIELPLVGGRSGGFRTYSVNSNLMLGKWRVNVENIRGQVVGRIRFNVVQTTSFIPTETKILE